MQLPRSYDFTSTSLSGGIGKMMALASGRSEVPSRRAITSTLLTAQFPDQWISTRRRRNPSINGFTEGRSRGPRRFFLKVVVRGVGAVSTIVPG